MPTKNQRGGINLATIFSYQFGLATYIKITAWRDFAFSVAVGREFINKDRSGRCGFSPYDEF